MRSRLRGGGGRQRGQATVEFALILPLLLLLVLAVVQVGLVALTKLAVTHTAREVARALAVDARADPGAVAERARPFGSGRLEIDVEWQVTASGRVVIVRVSDVVEGIAGPWSPEPEVATTIAMLGG